MAIGGGRGGGGEGGEEGRGGGGGGGEGRGEGEVKQKEEKEGRREYGKGDAGVHLGRRGAGGPLPPPPLAKSRPPWILTFKIFKTTNCAVFNGM